MIWTGQIKYNSSERQMNYQLHPFDVVNLTTGSQIFL